MASNFGAFSSICPSLLPSISLYGQAVVSFALGAVNSYSVIPLLFIAAYGPWPFEDGFGPAHITVHIR